MARLLTSLALMALVAACAMHQAGAQSDQSGTGTGAGSGADFSWKSLNPFASANNNNGATGGGGTGALDSSAAGATGGGSWWNSLTGTGAGAGTGNTATDANTATAANTAASAATDGAWNWLSYGAGTPGAGANTNQAWLNQVQAGAKGAAKGANQFVSFSYNKDLANAQQVLDATQGYSIFARQGMMMNQIASFFNYNVQPMTIFAPSDQAILNAIPRLGVGMAQLPAILMTHVVSGTFKPGGMQQAALRGFGQYNPVFKSSAKGLGLLYVRGLQGTQTAANIQKVLYTGKFVNVYGVDNVLT